MKKYMLIVFFTSLTFSQSENEKPLNNNQIKKFINGKRIWCASSTHNSEELMCGLVHKELKKKYKNLLSRI